MWKKNWINAIFDAITVRLQTTATTNFLYLLKISSLSTVKLTSTTTNSSLDADWRLLVAMAHSGINIFPFAIHVVFSRSKVDKRDPLNDIFVRDKYKHTIFQPKRYIFRSNKQNFECERLINYMGQFKSTHFPVTQYDAFSLKI